MTAEVVFLIPLIARDRARDWDVVQRRLAATLAALRAQSAPGWRALVCGQNRPEAVDLSDPVSFVPFDRPAPAADAIPPRFDNHDKRDALLDRLAAEGAGPGYVFNLDADDVLHPDLVAHIQADDNGGGYWIERGYMMDLRTGAMAYMGPKTWRFPAAHTFIRECGSSAALPFDFRRDAQVGLTILKDRPKHAGWPAHMARHGFAMAPVPFPAALYVLGHGDNLRARRGKMGAKARYLRRNRLLPRAVARVQAEFKLEEEPQ